MAAFSFFSPSDFVEREAWERGFAQIFARDIAPHLVRLERLRWLVIVAVCLIAIVTAAASLTFLGLAAVTTPPKSLAGRAYSMAGGLVLAAGVIGGYLLARWFRRHEERLFLSAVCRQFDGVTVQVAPAGATVSALEPYWDLGLIARPKEHYRPRVGVRELFTAERRGVALSLVAIDLHARFGRKDEYLFRGDLVELMLPDPGPGSEYAAGRFDADHLGDADMSAGSHDLRTPRVAQALADVGGAFGAPQVLGAVSGNQVYLAVPFSEQAERTARIGLWRPVYRCEPAIRAALAQLDVVLRLTDAVAEACAQPAAQSAWAGGAAAVPAPVAPLPQNAAAARQARLARLAGLALAVAMGVAAVGIALWAEVYTPHRDAPAVAQIRQTAEQGDAAAQHSLGIMYWNGRDVAHDDGEALRWFRKAADQGYADAENNLGWAYKNGRGVARDYGEAMRWYRKAADQGDARAQTNIGALYWDGSGVAQDYGEAMRWYRMAADQGNAAAQNAIGTLYQNGWGVAQDYGEAMRWCRLAAAQGNARAQYHIGTLYANGWGVPGDPGEARNWMQKAAARGDQDAKKWFAAR